MLPPRRFHLEGKSLALLLTSTETRQTIIIGSKNTCFCPRPAEEASEPAEPKSIQNQLFKLREGGLWGDTLWLSYCIPSCQSLSGRDSLFTLLVYAVSVVLCLSNYVYDKRINPSSGLRAVNLPHWKLFSCVVLKLYWNKRHPACCSWQWTAPVCRKKTQTCIVPHCLTSNTRTSTTSSLTVSLLLSQMVHTCPRINLALWPPAAELAVDAWSNISTYLSEMFRGPAVSMG